MQTIEPNISQIRSSFMMKPAEDGKSIEVIENFEMSKEFEDSVMIPYLKQRFSVYFQYSQK